MTETMSLTGMSTEEIASIIGMGVKVNKYEDPTEGERLNLTKSQALEVAGEDVSLLWVNKQDVSCDNCGAVLCCFDCGACSNCGPTCGC